MRDDISNAKRHWMKMRARELRNNQTKAEKVLWEVLRRGQVCGLLFLRQFRVGSYIADFYCAALRLVVEVDGSIHDEPEQQERDRLRDLWCERNGYWVMRFENWVVLGDLQGVIDRLLRAVAPMMGEPFEVLRRRVRPPRTGPTGFEPTWRDFWESAKEV